MCDKVSKDLMLKYCPDKYNIQKMCYKAVDSYLLALKFVPDWFVTSKMIKKFDNALFSNDYLIFGDIGSDIVTSFRKDTGLTGIKTLIMLFLIMIILMIMIRRILIMLDL